MAASMSVVYTEYLQTKMQTVLEAMVTSMLVDRPNEVEPYMLDWLSKWHKEQGGSLPTEDGTAKPAAAGDSGDVKNMLAERDGLLKQRDALKNSLSLVGSAPAEEKPAEPPKELPPRCESVASVTNSEKEAELNAAEDAKEKEMMEKMKKKGARAGVSAQAISADKMKDFVKPVYPKSDEDKAHLKEIIDRSDKLQVLFGHLTETAIFEVIDAMFKKSSKNGETIIKQGDEGDNFYIVDTGSFDVFVARTDMDPLKVLDYGNDACFGELALMYGAPRAATVVATSDSEVWALEAETFKMMLITAENTKKKEYEGFLEKVEILRDLTKYEMSQLSDMLESELFDAGETIIAQGDVGNYFYIVEDGAAKAYIGGEQGEIEVKSYETAGEYFGEIALLTSATRKATVRAAGQGCAVLSVNRDDFVRVLGPIKDILAKNMDKYPQYAEFVKQEQEKEAAEAEEQKKIDQMTDKTRRAGVSAQAVNEDRMKDWKKPHYDKPEETRQKLKKIIDSSDKLQVLFGHLEDEAVMGVIDAMFQKEVAGGDDIIKQGQEGDNFYIVEEGEFDVFIARTDQPPLKVLEYSAGACFGELALMYNAPRAATVTAKPSQSAKVWALDRETFQMMLVTSENTKKKEYEGFLEQVAILADLTKYEMAQLSDMLESELFDAGEAIITQGDSGNYFYIIEDGEARAYITGEQGEVEVKQYTIPGDYFGEIALITNAQRKASVRAAGQGCSVLSVRREDFDRVLGPVKDILEKKIDQYPQYAAMLPTDPAP
jgi:cAMP-dependent protein kinase regulator